MAADSSATATTVVEICFYDNAGYYTKGQEVKFLVSVKKQAVNVTALDGSNINVTVNGRRDSGRRSWFRGNGNGVGCYNCGAMGHIDRQCTRGTSVVGSRACYNCGGMGHIARQCTRGTSVVGSRASYNCGVIGHIARQCTRGTSVVGSRACYNCGEDGAFC
ncbi:cold shock domain-containing protein 3-like protein [Tanacetum coccineum]